MVPCYGLKRGIGELLNLLRPLGLSDALYRGIDVASNRVVYAASKHPQADFIVGSAHELPLADAEFDLVAQFTTFSSLLESSFKAAAAAEIDRVLRPGAHVLWYDFWLNPLNRETRGIGKTEIRSQFPAYGVDLRKMTLAPPLARAAATLSPTLCSYFERVSPLRTHYLGVFRKPTDRTS